MSEALFMLNHLIYSFDHEDESKLKIPIEYIIHQCLLEKFQMIQPIYNIYFQYNPEFIVHKTQRVYGSFNIKFSPFKNVFKLGDWGVCQPGYEPAENNQCNYDKKVQFPKIIDIRVEESDTELFIDETIFHIKVGNDRYEFFNISLHRKDNHLILMEFLNDEPDDHHNTIFIAVRPLQIDLLNKSISMETWPNMEHYYRKNVGKIFNLLKNHFKFDKHYHSVAGWS